MIEQALSADKPEVKTGEATVNNDRLGKPRLGVTIRTLRGAELTDGQIPNGAYIVEVDENGPAAKAGLQPGDILVEVNGNVIGSNEDLMAQLEGTKAGDVMKVTVWRPDTVEDVEKIQISYDGDYIENIEVTLEVLEEANNT